MNPVEIKQAMDCEAALPEFEEREYLGISSLSRCRRELARWMRDGRERPGLKGRRMFHEGYLHERDVISRLEAGGIAVTGRGREVVYDLEPRLRGHIDGLIGEAVLEIKSVTTEKFNLLTQRGGNPFAEHRAQTQLYMRFLDYEYGVIVYKDRQFGALWVCEVRPDRAVEEAMIVKALEVLQAVDTGILPACECGRCKG